MYKLNVFICFYHIKTTKKKARIDKKEELLRTVLVPTPLKRGLEFAGVPVFPVPVGGALGLTLPGFGLAAPELAVSAKTVYKPV